MALEFLCDAEVGEAELVVRLDLKGVEALLAAMHSALAAGREPCGAGAEERVLNAFNRVTFRFLDPVFPAN